MALTDSIAPYTVTTAEFEFSLTVPAGTGGLEIENLSGQPLRVAFITGKVALPNDTSQSVIAIAPNAHHNFGEVNFEAAGTLYYASSLLNHRFDLILKPEKCDC